MSLRAWIKAARPLAQANMAGPLLLGEAFAYATTSRFSWLTFGLVAAFGVADQLFIVFANDYADRKHDTDRRTLFSGGSGVLQSGELHPASLRRAAIAMGAMLPIIAGTIVGLAPASPTLLVLAASAIVLMWAYSFAPLRLSYRGGGEWLQGLGVGGVLPLFGYVAQAGTLDGVPWSILLGTTLLAASANVATALPDVADDRRAKKRTWPVRLGAARASWSCLGLTVAALYGIAWTGQVHFDSGWLAWAVVPLVPLLRGAPRTPSATLRFIVFHGIATQTVFLGWAAWLFGR